MILCIAEKSNMALKIALGLGDVEISGRKISYDDLTDNRIRKIVEKEQAESLHLDVNCNGKLHRVVWASGHIVEMKRAEDYDETYKHWTMDKFPFIPEKFEYKVKNDKDSQKIYKYLCKQMNSSDVEAVYNICDPDREGELIFYEIYKMCKCTKPIKRVWLKSLTQYAIKEGFDKMADNSQMANLLHAARCRSMADWQLGINMTVLSTLSYGDSRRLLSVGRVQTPVLAEIVKRDNAIKKHRPVKTYGVEFDMIEINNQDIVMTFKTTSENMSTNKAEAKKLAEELKSSSIEVLDVTRKHQQDKPPLLYNLSSLMEDAEKKYSLTSAEVISAAEKLYIKEILTYPRTDSTYLTRDMKQYVLDIIDNLPERYDSFKSKLVLNKIDIQNTRVFNDDKVEGHTAIIPTNVKHSMDLLRSLSENEQKVYGLVMRNFLKSFMSNAQYENIKIILGTEKGIKLVASCRICLKLGYKYADKKTKVEEKEVTEVESDVQDIPKSFAQLIDCIEKDKNVSLSMAKVFEKESRPKKHYTDATLIKFMKNPKNSMNPELEYVLKEQGIGTPATRHQVIQKLLGSEYIQRVNKKYLVSTGLGRKFISTLKNNDLKTIDMTAEWEHKLDMIARGEYSPDKFMEEIKEYTLNQCQELKEDNESISLLEPIGTCPNCGGKIARINGGYACENLSKGQERCFEISEYFYGKKITDSIVSELLLCGKTKRMNGFVSSKSKKTYPASIVLMNVNGRMVPKLAIKPSSNTSSSSSN